MIIMRKVKVITLQNIRNYGSVLQALATQEMFKSIDFEVSFIDFRRHNSKDLKTKLNNWVKQDRGIKRLIKKAVLLPTMLYQDRVFTRFIEKYLSVDHQICTTDEDFSKLKLDADLYCTGSDQTWNSGWNGGLVKSLFLNFVPDGKPKVAYAASFGKSELEDWEKEETKRLLERYDLLSVREAAGVEIINNLGLDSVEHVLDPTIQLDRNYWKQYAVERKIKEKYVLVYQLNTNPKFDKYAENFATKRGAKLYRFCTRYDQIFSNGKSLVIPEVLDFVNLIMNADCVITDSFHATAFSINSNTNFISVFPEHFSSRLASILKLTSLEDRQLKDYEDYSFVSKDVDFTNANNVLVEQRRKGVEFLNKIKHLVDGYNN